MVNLLIVESPGKIKKILSYIPNNFIVKASMGHIRQLANDGEDNLGFELIGDRVNCRYDPKDSKAKKLIVELRKIAKTAQGIYLATDPDREGETISWHLSEVLRAVGKNRFYRITFNEITKDAISYALAHPRAINLDLVNAGLARSCFDKLVGFRGSPLLWNIGAKSMGRVQSAVLHLLCAREREIINFQPVDYFSVFVDYAEGFRAFYLSTDRARTEFQQESGNAQPPISSQEQNNSERPESTRIFKQSEAEALIAIANTHSHSIINIEQKKVAKSPPPPFTTSTFQQAAGSKLHFSPDKTMQLAQKLYEKGLITYMRTDSVHLSEEFCQSAKAWLSHNDPHNFSENTTKHRSNKNSQEAHEAIRPTDINYPSSKLKMEVSEDEFNLYVLVWKRAIASQCKSAIINQTKIISQSGAIFWLAKGKTAEFLGYAKYWSNLIGDRLLPDVNHGQALNLEKSEFEKKTTSPPSRFTEPQLVALMEKKGIGRPSTYSSSIKTIKSRNYAKLNHKKLFPTELGVKVDEFLGKTFSQLIEPQFTADMEENLDKIAEGQLNWEKYLTSWNRDYFARAIAQARSLLPETSSSKFQGEISPTKYLCPICQNPLEQYTYTKYGQQKSLLRCSDSLARDQPNHKNAVFFSTKFGNWWNKEFGELGERLNPNELTSPSFISSPKIQA